MTGKAIIKVCIHTTCAHRGSCAIFQRLQAEMYDEAAVREYPHCFDACDDGPNISVNGELIHRVSLETAVQYVRRALERPSLKSDGQGIRPLSELDDVLDDLTRP
jgi:NADH:ubiquinone oxidoreductase subunit E